jgi:DNA-binding LytR/AlgR family response regulator
MADIISDTTEDFQIECLIVDDEENAIDGIVDYLNEINNIQVVDTCFSAIEAMEVLKYKQVGLMFLDINMPRLSGLEFLESLQNPPIVILTTAYSEFALEAFRLNVADYLLKPYTFQRFLQATQKAVGLFKTQQLSNSVKSYETKDMFIRQSDSSQRINCHDILMIEAMQNYLKLYFKNKTYVIHQTMSAIEEILPKEMFFRIHNSFLVNVNHIESVGKNRLIVNDKEVPISKYRKRGFMNLVVYKKLISK